MVKDRKVWEKQFKFDATMRVSEGVKNKTPVKNMFPILHTGR